jgi:hypothetical protein
MEYRHVDIAPLDLTMSAPFRVRLELPGDPRLAESISEHGVLAPPLLAGSGKRFVVVSGFRRLAAAREAGLASVPSLFIDDTGGLPAGVVALWLESLDQGGRLDGAEQVILASKAAEAAGGSLGDHLPVLSRIFGRKMTPASLDEHARLAELGEDVLASLASGDLSPGDLLKLDRHPGIDTRTAARMLAGSGLSRSARRSVIRDMLYLASVGDAAFERFASGYDKDRPLDEQVGALTHPSLSEDIRFLEGEIAEMQLPPQASIRLPENLEGGGITAEIRIRRSDDLRLSLERLGEAVDRGLIKRILERLSRGRALG